MNPLITKAIDMLPKEKEENKALRDGTNKEIEFMFRNCDIGVLAQHYRNVGANQALSDCKQSLPLIFKMIKKELRGIEELELFKLRSCENDKINWNYHQGKVHQLQDLLTLLSDEK